MKEPLFDRLSAPMQVLFLIGVWALAPLLFVAFYVPYELPSIAELRELKNNRLRRTKK